MIKPIQARTMLLFAAFAAFPAVLSGAAAAQTLAERDDHAISASIREAQQQDISALGAAIEEASRSPFHVGTRTDASVALHLIGHLPAHPAHRFPQTATPESPPSFAKIFVLTLPVTYLADLAGLWALVCGASGGDGSSGSGCIDSQTINLAILPTVPVAVPALAAGAIAGRFTSTFLGSALGAGAAFLGGALVTDSWPAVFLPAIHAAVTAGFAMHK